MTDLPPPGRAPASAPAAPDLVAPKLRRRMACWLYEGVLLFGVLMAAAAAFSIPADMRSGMDPRRPLLFAFCVLVLGVYYVYCWTRGQTLPQKAWRLKVVDRHGQPPTVARATGRFLLSWLWFAPLLLGLGAWPLRLSEKLVLLAGWVAVWALLSRFHPQRQFWHDALAGTRIIATPDPKASSGS